MGKKASRRRNIGTLSKFLLMILFRRLRVKLLINLGITGPKILSYSPTVKEKIAFGNNFVFKGQIDDFPLNIAFFGKTPKTGVQEELFT